MKVYYDLHIHSCLSPCGDEDMTPNNIINMALIKALDVIAITDHNTSKNARTICELGSKAGLLVVPGIEVQTKEEVHALCYFSTIEDLERFDEALDPYRINIPNKVNVFGHQKIMNEMDETVGEFPQALIMSIDISLEKLLNLCHELHGVLVPAHVNKSSHSIFANLGFIPPDLKIKTVEVHRNSPLNEKFVKGYNIIYNSDAHYLEHISERENYFELKSLNRETILNYLRGEE